MLNLQETINEMIAKREDKKYSAIISKPLQKAKFAEGIYTAVIIDAGEVSYQNTPNGKKDELVVKFSVFDDAGVNLGSIRKRLKKDNYTNSEYQKAFKILAGETSNTEDLTLKDIMKGQHKIKIGKGVSENGEYSYVKQILPRDYQVDPNKIIIH
jgi:hypothetical protein